MVEQGLPIYLPNAKVCHMDQYHCCTRRTYCRLYPVCSKMQVPSVCKRDCPNCTYEGCSLGAEDRRNAPVYIAGVIQGERIDLQLESRSWKEHSEHRREHKAMYYYYNCLFNDYRTKHNDHSRKKYHENIEASRAKARKYAEVYRQRCHPPSGKSRRIYYPKCGLDCEHCPHQDCILPLDWDKQLYAARQKESDPQYQARYYRENKERLNAYSRQYYESHREQMRVVQKAYRQRPEVKARLAEKARQYSQVHREELKAYKAAWYQKNKQRINEERRKSYANKKQTGRNYNP